MPVHKRQVCPQSVSDRVHADGAFHAVRALKHITKRYRSVACAGTDRRRPARRVAARLMAQAIAKQNHARGCSHAREVAAEASWAQRPLVMKPQQPAVHRKVALRTPKRPVANRPDNEQDRILASIGRCAPCSSRGRALEGSEFSVQVTQLRPRLGVLQTHVEPHAPMGHRHRQWPRSDLLECRCVNRWAAVPIRQVQVPSTVGVVQGRGQGSQTRSPGCDVKGSGQWGESPVLRCAGQDHADHFPLTRSALRSRRLGANACDGGDENSHESGNDADGDQQFDQGESDAGRSPCCRDGLRCWHRERGGRDDAATPFGIHHTQRDSTNRQEHDISRQCQLICRSRVRR